MSKGQRYLLVVTCHDTGRLVWAGKERTKETLGRFFDDLGAERAAALTHVSADGAEFIRTVVSARAPRAVLCPDPFYGDLRVMPRWGLSCLVGMLPAARRSA
jgi:transposase